MFIFLVFDDYGWFGHVRATNAAAARAYARKNLNGWRGFLDTERQGGC